jgi:hypothetical protein
MIELEAAFELLKKIEETQKLDLAKLIPGFMNIPKEKRELAITFVNEAGE